MRALTVGWVLALCMVALAPISWHVISSLKSSDEIVRLPPTLIPESPTVANYEELFARRPFIRYAVNSFVIASLSSVLCVFSASLAAYRLARGSARFRFTVTSGLLALAFLPPIVFLFPLYELVRLAGMVNHPWSLIVAYAGLNTPMAVWLLTGYFEKLPLELEEAAAIDGLNAWQTFLRIILPLSTPALVSAIVLVFVFSWNEFMLALTFISSEQAKTITLGVSTLSGALAYDIPYGLIAAGVVASSAPLIVLVLFFQRRIVAGLTAGSIK
jgi:multiple sugar transport system permease protein